MNRNLSNIEQYEQEGRAFIEEYRHSDMELFPGWMEKEKSRLLTMGDPREGVVEKISKKEGEQRFHIVTAERAAFISVMKESLHHSMDTVKDLEISVRDIVGDAARDRLARKLEEAMREILLKIEGSEPHSYTPCSLRRLVYDILQDDISERDTPHDRCCVYNCLRPVGKVGPTEFCGVHAILGIMYRGRHLEIQMKRDMRRFISVLCKYDTSTYDHFQAIEEYEYYCLFEAFESGVLSDLFRRLIGALHAELDSHALAGPRMRRSRDPLPPAPLAGNESPGWYGEEEENADRDADENYGCREEEWQEGEFSDYAEEEEESNWRERFYCDCPVPVPCENALMCQCNTMNERRCTGIFIIETEIEGEVVSKTTGCNCYYSLSHRYGYTYRWMDESIGELCSRDILHNDLLPTRVTIG